MLFKYAHPRVPAQAVEALATDPQKVGATVTIGVVVVELAQVPDAVAVVFVLLVVFAAVHAHPDNAIQSA